MIVNGVIWNWYIFNGNTHQKRKIHCRLLWSHQIVFRRIENWNTFITVMNYCAPRENSINFIQNRRPTKRNKRKKWKRQANEIPENEVLIKFLQFSTFVEIIIRNCRSVWLFRWHAIRSFTFHLSNSCGMCIHLLLTVPHVPRTCSIDIGMYITFVQVSGECFTC